MFSDCALRLAGITGALLGWRPADFWAATPAELAAIVAAMAGDGPPSAADAADLARLTEAFPDG